MIDLNRLLAKSCLRHAEWLGQTDSTNDRAIERSKDPSFETPYLIGADQQYAGRGRGTNQWWGADGSLMFSIAIDMSSFGLSTRDWPRFSLITGLAVSETLAAVLPSGRVGLKWPNDVWLNGRKVCGILIEQVDRMSDRFIVGIGMNINNSFVEAPAKQRQIATSLKDEGHGVDFSRTDVLIDFLGHWNSLVKHLADDTVSLVERWSHLCVLSGRPVTVTSGNHETTGICTGIDDEGALLLRTAFATERCYSGTVRLLD